MKSNFIFIYIFLIFKDHLSNKLQCFECLAFYQHYSESVSKNFFYFQAFSLLKQVKCLQKCMRLSDITLGHSLYN